jgi:HD-GYP domain-containing protein (c-di-GMP phosphodiesterase class II)
VDPKGPSAHGGSARTQAIDAEEHRWRSRRAPALAVRAAAVLLPFTASLVVGRVLAVALPAPHSPAGTVGWWAVVVACSTVALLAVDRVARRLLPVATLFRLALVFPDKAPSRFSVALRSGTARQLRERLSRGEELGATPGEAAENLLALVTALGKHDRITRGHSERVRAYSDVIAAEMGLSQADRERLHWAALVHDVGKMAVRPELLNKVGRPDESEWQELRNHPAAAAAMVQPLRSWLGQWVDAATQHHERYDGQGYPYGLTGDDITLAGRIVAVADAYDCMTSTRSYKKALPAAQARFELTRNSGTQFDPVVVRAFLGVSVGRLSLAGGPLSWLAQVPGAREAATLSGAGGASVSAGVAAVAVAAVGAVSGALMPQEPVEPISAARLAPIEQVVESGPSSEGTIEMVVASGEPDATTTAPPSTTEVPQGVRVSTTTTVASTRTSTSTASSLPSGSTSTTAPAVATSSTQVPVATTTEPPNEGPVALDDSASVELGDVVDVLVLANDSDDHGLVEGSLTILSIPPPGKGSVEVVSGGRIRYTSQGYTPSTTFTYRICDAANLCAQATVTITIV